MLKPTETKPNLWYLLLFLTPFIAAIVVCLVFRQWWIAGLVFALGLYVTVVFQCKFHRTVHKASKSDYSHIMLDTLLDKPDTKLTDIAMVGAHDAFTHKMCYHSDVDPTSTEVFAKPFLANVGRGLIKRLSKAQMIGSYDLLKKGARFFDVRICQTKKGYATKHGIMSDLLAHYILGILKFFDENKGEILVFGIQYCTFLDKDYDDLFDTISTISYNGKNLFDYVNYNSKTQTLCELTYGNLTNNGQNCSIVFLAKVEEANYCGRYADNVYDFAASTRITWHNQMDNKKMLAGIRAEAAFLRENKGQYETVLRINQAQKTPSFSLPNMLKIIAIWSLIDMARYWNPAMLAAHDFDEWLEQMPIIFVDFIDCGRKNFHNRLIEKINQFNKNI